MKIKWRRQLLSDDKQLLSYDKQLLLYDKQLLFCIIHFIENFLVIFIISDIGPLVGGVQSSLNMNNFFNMTKFLIVILLPNLNTFDILIILSFIFVSLGVVSVTYYTLQRGKLSLNCCGFIFPSPTIKNPSLSS